MNVMSEHVTTEDEEEEMSMGNAAQHVAKNLKLFYNIKFPNVKKNCFYAIYIRSTSTHKHCVDETESLDSAVLTYLKQLFKTI